jgi:2-phosphoglycerate kinase
MVWVDYSHSGRPLILLIGGTTGCGKSTMATEVAHRLGVVRTQSTDMLREVMRMMVPKRLSPVLHTSAFDAWRSLPDKFANQADEEERIADGYQAQMELLSVPCEAVIQRALKERVALILEGIHIHPSLLNYIDRREDAIIVPIMLAVLKQDNLRMRLRSRGQAAPSRDSKKHLSNFDRIWTLQSFLLSEADRHGIPIIANEDKEKATAQVMKAIIDTMEGSFSRSPEEVFGHEE